MKLLTTVNLLLPGSGLVLRDRLAAGLALLALSVGTLALAALAPLIATPDFAGRLLLAAAVAYLLLAATAGGLWWWLERQRTVERAAVLRLHRATATAYLAGDQTQARSHAQALCRIAPQLAGAWQLLAEVERAAGDAAAAERAEQRSRTLQRRLRERGETAVAA